MPRFRPAPATASSRASSSAAAACSSIFGEHSAWPSGDTDLLPGTLGAITDPANGRGGAIGFIDYSHPVFEVFKAPRSGDFSSAHIFRYRALAAGPGARILARFDDGAVAAAERRVGAGRVIAWTSTLDDSWSDLAVKPVYLPLVHQLVRYLAHYEQPLSWQTVGQVLDLPAAPKARGDRVIVTPSGQRISQAAGAAGLLELNEQGVYEIRGAGVPGAEGARVPGATGAGVPGAGVPGARVLHGARCWGARCHGARCTVTGATVPGARRQCPSGGRIGRGRLR